MSPLVFLLLGVSAAAADGPRIRHPAPGPEPPPPGPITPPPIPPGDPSESSPILALSTRTLEFQGVARSGQSYTLPVLIVLYGGGSGQRWTARSVTYSGGVWLSLSPPAGEDDATLQVTATVGKLARGTYSGAVTISAEAQNSPQVIQVVFHIRDPQPAALELSSTALRFSAVTGTQSPPPQELVVFKQGETPLNWRVQASTSSGGSWLSVTPASGSEQGRVTARAELGSLAPGEYSGTITVSSDEAINSPLRVTVLFTVDRQAPVLRLSASQLNFVVTPEAPSPPPQQIAVSNAGYGTLSWRATAVTFNGGAWLTITPGASAVTVAVDAAGLPGGSYTGRITFTAEGATNSPLPAPVTLTVERLRPQFTRETVVNAASLQAGRLAPGEIVSIFGSRLGPAGTTVTFDGLLAPLLFSSYYQLNLVVPFGVAGKTSARLAVSAAGTDPAEIVVAIAEAAPGLFTVDGRRAAALNQDGVLNSPESPAPPGSIVQLFLTGQGLLDTRVETGAPAPLAPPWPVPVLPVRVAINALDAVVRFAGLAPGTVGLAQLNVEIPREVATSDWVRVVVSVGGIEAPPVFIAVRPSSGSPPP